MFQSFKISNQLYDSIQDNLKNIQINFYENIDTLNVGAVKNLNKMLKLANILNNKNNKRL